MSNSSDRLSPTDSVAYENENPQSQDICKVNICLLKVSGKTLMTDLTFISGVKARSGIIMDEL